MTTRQRRTERGFSLIELMVGVVIGLIAVLVIYEVFAAAEGIKRNTTSVGDAQQNGLMSSFMLGIELANAGNGVSTGAQSAIVAALVDCPGGVTFQSTWRPVPVMIIPGAGPTDPDTFMVSYSVSNAMIAPMPFWAAADAADSYLVQSPMGFQQGDLVIAIAKGSPGSCAASVISANPTITDAANGVVTISHSGPIGAGHFDKDSSTLFDMGLATNSQKTRFDVVAGVLRSTALLKADGSENDDSSPAPNPLASNVINMKIQYGVDAGGGAIAWKSADTSPWTPPELLGDKDKLISYLKLLKAVRIGIVVQGEQWDKNAPDSPWKLFGGVINGGYEGTFLRAGGNYRYRTYETVIPLRNGLWNNS